MTMWRGHYICSIYSLLLAPRVCDAKGCFFAKSLPPQLKAEADAVHCQHRKTCSDLSHPPPLFIGNFNSCKRGEELPSSSNCLVASSPPHHEIFPYCRNSFSSFQSDFSVFVLPNHDKQHASLLKDTRRASPILFQTKILRNPVAKKSLVSQASCCSPWISS